MEYDCITLDTQVIERSGFNFDGGLLGQLKQFAGGPTKVVISAVVYLEVERHLRSQTQAAKEAVDRAHKAAVKYGLKLQDEPAFETNPDPNSVSRARVRQYFQDIGAEIIRVDSVTPRTLLRMYFQSKPPFAKSGVKKNEFPDAIALVSLEQWAKARDKRILAVSADKDWSAFVELSDYIDVVPTLSEALEILQEQHAEQAGSVVETFLAQIKSDPTSELTHQFESRLGGAIEFFDVTAEASSAYSFETDTVLLRLNDFEFPDSDEFRFQVAQAGPNKIVVGVDLRVSVTAQTSFTYARIDEEGDYLPVGTSDEEIGDINLEVTALTTIEGNFDSGEVTVVNVEITNGPKSINFGIVEPDYSGDAEEFWNVEAGELATEEDEPDFSH